MAGNAEGNGADDSAMFHDNIHLNEYGYCTLINDFRVQYALGCNLLKRDTYSTTCSDQSAWIPWTIGASAVAVLAGISAVVAVVTGGDDEETMAGESGSDADKEKIGKDLDQVDNMSADFD
jgi:hypothetical protein